MDRLKFRLKQLYRNSRISFIFLSIMLAYFIFISLNGGTSNSQALVRYGAFYPPFIVAYRQYYRFITSIFIHIGILHLFFNAYALYVLGPQIERLMGARKYFFFFLLTGIGGNLATFLFNFSSLSAGASGSLFGLFGVFLYLIHRHGDMISPQGRRSVLQLIVINLILTVTVPSISTTAHLGGLVMGYLLSHVFVKL